MSTKAWHAALQSVKPFIFRILTPSGHGTGFQILYAKNKNFCAIATAYHVIEHEDEWEETIKIAHLSSGKVATLKPSDRVIFKYPKNDLAFIVFNKGLLPLEQKDPKLMDKNKILKQGAEVAWCGFPSIAPVGELCFFAGYISCCLESEDAYLVDGVAINGVSGGPAFYIPNNSDEVKFCGVISAYRPNRTRGEALPGLCIIQSVEPYHDDLVKIHSLDDAAEKAKEEKEKEETIKTTEPKLSNSTQEINSEVPENKPKRKTRKK